MQYFKDNYYYLICIFIIFTSFYLFEIWKLYPTYGGDFLQDWRYILDYSNCTLNINNPNCNALLQFKFVYPEIWFRIALFFQDKFYLLIYPFIIFYIISSLTFFKNIKKIYHFFFILSPTSMLLIQRGNNEIVIYFLIFIFLILLNRNYKIFSFFTLLISITLKFYPILLSPLYLLNIKNRKLSILIFFILALIGIYIFKDLLITQSIIHSNILLTYSSSVIVKLINIIFDVKYVVFIFYLLLLIIIFIFLLKTNNQEYIFINKKEHENSFLIGTLILVPSFFLSSSFDYRYIFIIFTFPYLNSFFKKNFNKKKSELFFIIILFSLWFEIIVFNYYEYINFNQFKNAFGYDLNQKTLLFGSLILIKNFLYWAVNFLLIFILFNIIKNKLIYSGLFKPKR